MRNGGIPLLNFCNTLLPGLSHVLYEITSQLIVFFSAPWGRVGFPGGSNGKESACSAGDLGSILGFHPWEDPLEEGMATCSSILAWIIPWTEETGGLQSKGSQRVGHNWVTSLYIKTQRSPSTNSCLTYKKLGCIFSVWLIRSHSGHIVHLFCFNRFADK